MFMNMDYSQLLQKARELGGPHKLVARIKAEGYREGVRDARRGLLPKILLAAGAGAALAIGAQRLKWFLEDCRAESLAEVLENDLTDESDHEREKPEAPAEEEQ